MRKCLATMLAVFSFAAHHASASDLADWKALKPNPGAALKAAPECDREIMIQVLNQWYAVGLLHQRWRVAVSSLEVQTPRGPYRLAAAFNAAGELIDLTAFPPEVLPEGMAAACLGLTAENFCPAETPAADPRRFLKIMASHFSQSLEEGALERAVRHALLNLDTWTGATP